MKLLINYGFTNDDLKQLFDLYTEDTFAVLQNRENEIKKLLDYLQNYGIVNLNEIIMNDINILFINQKEIEKMFSRYNPQYIIDSFKTNPNFFQEL